MSAHNEHYTERKSLLKHSPKPFEKYYRHIPISRHFPSAAANHGNDILSLSLEHMPTIPLFFDTDSKDHDKSVIEIQDENENVSDHQMCKALTAMLSNRNHIKTRMTNL